MNKHVFSKQNQCIVITKTNTINKLFQFRGSVSEELT